MMPHYFRPVMFTLVVVLIMIALLLLHWQNRFFAHAESPAFGKVNMPVILTQAMGRLGVPEQAMVGYAQKLSDSVSQAVARVSDQHHVVLFSSQAVVTALPDFTDEVLQMMEATND